MTEATPLFDAHFDGETYEPKRDKARLQGQMREVFNLMIDGEWRTLNEISQETGAPEASVSARLRDLRKDKFGGHTVQRRRVAGGLYQYSLIPVVAQALEGAPDGN